MNARSHEYRTNGNAALKERECVVLRFPESETILKKDSRFSGRASVPPANHAMPMAVSPCSTNFHVVDERIGAETRERVMRESSFLYQVKHGTFAGNDDGIPLLHTVAMSACIGAFMCLVALL